MTPRTNPRSPSPALRPSTLGLAVAAGLVGIVALLAGLTALGGGTSASPATPSHAGEAPVEVVVMVAPHGWLVEQVGGERVRVVTLVEPGQAPETFQPTDGAVTRALGADLVFRAGLPSERGRWFEALVATGTPTVDLRRGLDLLAEDEGHGKNQGHGAGHGDGHSDGHADGDPHIWLSPRLLALQAETVADGLARVDPEGAPLYRERLDALRSLLTSLDRELTLTLAPAAGRPFFVFHPAWSYLARDYGLEQVAVEVEGQAPSDRELTRLQERARATGARALFVQPQVAPTSARGVAEALGVELVVIDPLAADVPENLRRVARRLVSTVGPGVDAPGAAPSTMPSTTASTASPTTAAPAAPVAAAGPEPDRGLS